MLPSHFGKPRTYQAPPGFITTLRADCSNKGCSVRAGIHIRFNTDPNLGDIGWQFVEEKPIFDRTNYACNSCKEYLEPTK